MRNKNNNVSIPPPPEGGRLLDSSVEKLVEKTKLLLENEKDKRALSVYHNIIEEYENGSLELRKKIINLKEPLLGAQIKYELDELIESPLDPDDRSFDNVYTIISREEITDLQGNQFASFFAPFKKLIEREKFFYKKSGYFAI